MKNYYDVYRDGERVYEALTCSEVSEKIGIPKGHIRIYAGSGHCYDKTYRISFSGKDCLFYSAGSRRTDTATGSGRIDAEWKEDFDRRWQQVVAPFQRVSWSRSRGKKLHVEVRHEEEDELKANSEVSREELKNGQKENLFG